MQRVVSFPPAQSSKEAREDVDNVKDEDITSAHVEHSHSHAQDPAAGGLSDPEHAPNVEYLRKKDYLMMYPRYETDYMESISPKHQTPEKARFFLRASKGSQIVPLLPRDLGN